MSATCLIRKDPDAGLLYTVEGSEATIVGCTQLAATHLDIPPVITVVDAQYRVTAVGESAFAYQRSLQSIRIPDWLTTIGAGAFEGSGLTEVHLHDGVRTVAPCAFFGCVRLQRVALPMGVTLQEQAFGGCSALKQENVDNIACLSEESIRRAGLPQNAPASPAVIYVDGQPAALKQPVKAPAEQLLEQGLALESEGRHTEAAAAYMQAHRLRPSVSRIDDLVQQLAMMKPVAEAEYRLALMLKFGLAPAKNPDGSPRPTAAELLRRLVDTSGIADAAYHLGDMLAGGYDVPADPTEAITLLKQAAEQGHERACLDLGYIYLHGTLARANAATAASYFARCIAMDGPYAPIAREEMAGCPTG